MTRRRFENLLVAGAFLAAVVLSLPAAADGRVDCERRPTHRHCTSPWTLIFDDQFSTPIARGDFVSATAGRWFSYPCKPDWTTYGGFYCSERVVSVHNGYLDYWLHAEDGKWWMAALVPELPGGRDQLYGRYELRWRTDAIPGYYGVPLLWPDSENYLADGEIDWPEGNLTGNFHGFIHHTGATSGGDQKQCSPGVAFASGWHTTVTEWRPNSVRLFLDGALVCEETVRTPRMPMHWVLQFTTSPQGLPPAGTSGHVLIDYARVWSYR
jgi:hypothetical protein